MRIGITGSNGFIGKHLKNYLELQESIVVVEFKRSYFDDKSKLQNFVKKCDAIVHLAALNRHDNQEQIYQTNIDLVKKIINACECTSSVPHVLFSSSTQEEQTNHYGRSKKEGRLLFEKWGMDNNSLVTGMIIPNVFGPFGQPNYNSVVATFCHKIVFGETPTLLNDSTLKLIYINELVGDIWNIIRNKIVGKNIIQHRHELKVSDLMSKLLEFHNDYMINGEIPNIERPIDLALFNTFRCFIPYDYFPRPFVNHKDNRGSFVEIVRASTSGQYSFSTTNPGVTRGNHFHTRKVERFAVIKGTAKISFRKIDSDFISEFILDGSSPGYVDMPIWHTHNIVNIGKDELFTLFWINEAYNPKDPDTYFLNV